MIARTCPHLSEHLLAINLAGFARHEMIAHPPRLLHSTTCEVLIEGSKPEKSEAGDDQSVQLVLTMRRVLDSYN